MFKINKNKKSYSFFGKILGGCRKNSNSKFRKLFSFLGFFIIFVYLMGVN